MNHSTESQCIDTHTVQAVVTLYRECPLSRHTDIYHFPRLNVSRDLDLLPMEIQREILDQRRFAPGRTTLDARRRE